jgi:endonuclease/exonuclease/phosphatase family metal-dependent hydrolase
MRARGVPAAIAAALLAATSSAADVAFATWNLDCFPSRRANRRMSETTERRNAKAVGEALGGMLESICQTNGAFVLFLQEVRDEKSCKSLLRYAGRPDASVASISGFTDSAGIPLWQQVAVATTLRPVETGFSAWFSRTPEPAPRGYAYAVLDDGAGGLVACFSLHLKSNLNLSGSLYGQQRNIYLREMASTQILAKIRSLRQTYGEGLKVVVAGDFNTDTDDARFVSEATLRSFYGAHYRSCFTGLKPEDRVTYPATGPYPDATFDYILFLGFDDMTGRYLFPGAPYSDHNFVAVTLR